MTEVELRNLKNDPGQDPALGRFRSSLGEMLRDNRITSAAGRGLPEAFPDAARIPDPAAVDLMPVASSRRLPHVERHAHCEPLLRSVKKPRE